MQFKELVYILYIIVLAKTLWILVTHSDLPLQIISNNQVLFFKKMITFVKVLHAMGNKLKAILFSQLCHRDPSNSSDHTYLCPIFLPNSAEFSSFIVASILMEFVCPCVIITFQISYVWTVTVVNQRQVQFRATVYNTVDCRISNFYGLCWIGYCPFSSD